MPQGPGKYDAEAAALQKSLPCQGVFLIVLGGPKGSGFSVVAEEQLVPLAPELLRSMADEIEQSSRS